MPDNIAFVWPSAGTMKITLLRGGGCNIRITFADQGVVRSIGNGRVVKAIAVPTKRIARRYEILIRHEKDFASSYSILDQTPSAPLTGGHAIAAEGDAVDEGNELYTVQNGGFLDFQLFRGGKVVDPRQFIEASFHGSIEVTSQTPES